MTYVLLIVCCVGWMGSLSAQAHLTTPLEMLTFMEASPTVYEFEQLHGSAPLRKRPVLPLGTYLQLEEQKEYALNYQDVFSAADSALFVQATDMLNVERPKYAKIRRIYQQLLRLYPECGLLHTSMGNTYYEEGQYDRANAWLEQALALNPIDYRARWLQAELFLAQGLRDTALHLLTIAHLYNRNHPRLLKRLIAVYKDAHIPYYHNWGFDPKMVVYKDGETVVIRSEGIWLTYGIYKAVWAHDTDYQYMKEQQSVSDYLTHQELEAALGTYLTYTELKHIDTRNYPAMNALGVALDQALFEEFVFYEIVLVDQPALAYHLTPAFTQRLIAYIQTIRSKDYVIDDE